jgi:hypothetical protein
MRNEVRPMPADDLTSRDGQRLTLGADSHAIALAALGFPFDF